MTAEFSRLQRRSDPERFPRAIDDETGLFVVDATWGAIQPISVAAGVRTVGELELIEHVRAGRPLVDCRVPHYVERGTIAGAVAGAVMVAVFLTFALSGPLPPKEMGIILGVAVLMDAALVRLLLLPVLLRLMGKRAWYLPRWARRVLPEVSFGHA